MIVCMHQKRDGQDCGKRASVSVPAGEKLVDGHNVPLQLCWRHARCSYVKKLSKEPIVRQKETGQ